MKVTSNIDFGWERESELPDWPLEALYSDVPVLYAAGVMKKGKLYSIHTVQGKKIYLSVAKRNV